MDNYSLIIVFSVQTENIFLRFFYVHFGEKHLTLHHVLFYLKHEKSMPSVFTNSIQQLEHSLL